MLVNYTTIITELIKNGNYVIICENGGDSVYVFDYKENEEDLLMNDLIPQWDSGVQHMADVFAGEGGFIPTCAESMEQLDDATKDYEKELTKLEKAAGANFDKIASGIDKNITKS